MPSKADTPRAMFNLLVANAGLPATPKTTVNTREMTTVIVAPRTERSPEAMGRFGLLILSISTSVIWFRPVMYKFISRAGIVAYTMLQTDRIVKASASDGAANMCRDGIARADPMIVWGRVNLHKTDRKEEIGRFPLLLFDGNDDDDGDDTVSKSGNTSL